MPGVDDCDTKSVTSSTSKSSKSSKYSVKSFMSKASSMSQSMKRGLSALTGSSRKTTASVAAMVDMVAGDICESVSLVTIRSEESLDSALVVETPPGQTLEILEVGQGRRVKVRTSTGLEGWISTKTKLNEPLVVKRQKEVEFAMDGWETGSQHEVKSMVTVRTAESLDSEVIGELKPGAIFTIKDFGATNKRRALIDSGVVVGWISLVTKNGEMLVGKVTKEKASGSTMFGTSGGKIKEMLEAARSGDVDMLRKLAEPSSGIMAKFTQKPNLNASDVRGKTALTYAASFGNKEVVDYLLSKGREIEVNAVDDTDKTALHHAARRTTPTDEERQADIISMLLTAKAYIEARDHNGCTPLMFAVANGNEAITRRLILAQANVNNFDYENHSCLNYATQFNQHKLVSLLKRAGARDKLSLDDDEEEEEEPEGTTPASGGKLKLPSPDIETTSCAESLSTEAPGLSPEAAESALSPASALSAATAGYPAEADQTPGAKKKVAKKKPKEGDEASPSDGAAKKTKKKDGDAAKGEKTTTKKKKAKADTGLGERGMMEAVAADVDTPITVQEPSEKKEEVVQPAGPSDEELAKAAEMKKAKEKASAELKDASTAGDVKRLEAALEKARSVEVSGAEIEAASKVLAAEQRKQEGRKKLQAAKESGNVDVLKAALEDAKAAGLSAAELKAVEDLIAAAESKEKVEAALKTATSERNVSGLKFAIQQAKEANIDAALIQAAEEVLRVEEPKLLAREQLAEACQQVTKAGLIAAIAAGKKANLDAAEYAKAEELLRREEEKEKLLKRVNEALAESQQVDMKSIDALREMREKLQTSLKEALAAGVAESDLVAIDQRRKKLHNAVEDLKGSIRVFCRVRPLSKKETGQGDTSICEAVDQMTVKVKDEQFAFDAVFTPGTQEEVFEDCRDLVQSAADGYNVTMFAYGQTGAGKTFTMYGTKGNEGTAPRTIHEIYRVCEQGSDRFTYTVMGSMLELYCNAIVDLLAKGNPNQSKAKLNIRQEKNGAVYMEGLTEEQCNTAEELMAMMDRGNDQRTVAATAMNSESSRSHLVLLIKIISVNKETKETLKGKMLMCDLAGSERLKKSEVTEHQQKEAIEINRSLTALGDVIEALTKGGKGVVPYRNHKLTQLMQDSLGGTAKTLMFVNCSPASSNLDETFMSLKYAQRAKKITNTATKSK